MENKENKMGKKLMNNSYYMIMLLSLMISIGIAFLSYSGFLIDTWVMGITLSVFLVSSILYISTKPTMEEMTSQIK